MRIEEIKERADKEEYVKRDIDYYEAQEDIQYILSKLEQAESFYEELVKDSHVWAEKAASLLKQIREE